MADYKTIKIKKNIFDKIASRAKDTSFNSADEYIEFILKEILAGLEDATLLQQTYSKEDEEKIKGRLRALGYLE